MGKYKALKKYIVEEIYKRTGSKRNQELYKKRLDEMSDKEMKQWLDDLEAGRTNLSMIEDSSINLSTNDYFDICDSVGLKTEHKLTYIDKPDRPKEYTPDNSTIVVLMPNKRLLQLITKKLALAKDDRSVDLNTGQVTNESAAAKITAPEIGIFTSYGMKESLRELAAIRGGDTGAYNAYVSQLTNYGEASQENIMKHATGVESINSLKQYFLGAQLRFIPPRKIIKE